MYEELLNTEWSELVHAAYSVAAVMAAAIVALLLVVMAVETEHSLVERYRHAQPGRRTR